MMMIMREGVSNEQYVARDTAPLVVSSVGFLLPCIYTVPRHQHFYTAMLVLTSGISANYWRKATYDWRRTADLWFSKFSFVVFFTKGLCQVHIFPRKDLTRFEVVAFYLYLIMMITCYAWSEAAYHRGSHRWIHYHFLFHVSIMLELTAILAPLKKSPVGWMW